MSFNGAGLFVINSAGQPVVAGTTITSTAFNALTADLATGLSTALCKDGQTTPTNNIPLGGFKLTGLGLATTANDALSYGQAATVATLTVAAINASGAINTTNVSGFVNSNAGVTISTTTGGIFSNAAVTVQAVSGGVILNTTATAWVSASDETLKTPFMPFTDALDKIAGIKVGTGRYLTDDEGVSRAFISAQSTQKVLPEAVSLYPSKEGQPHPWDGKLMMSPSDVVPLLIAALAEAKVRIEALEAK